MLIKTNNINELANLDESNAYVIQTSNIVEVFNYLVKNYQTIVVNPMTAQEVELCREHNNSKIMILDENLLSSEEINEFNNIFTNTKFSNEERHNNRISKIKEVKSCK